MTTRIYNLMTKFFPLVTSWQLMGKKLILSPALPNLLMLLAICLNGNGNHLNACVNRLQTVYNPVYFYPFNEKPLVSVFTFQVTHASYIFVILTSRFITLYDALLRYLPTVLLTELMYLHKTYATK